MQFADLVMSPTKPLTDWSGGGGEEYKTWTSNFFTPEFGDRGSEAKNLRWMKI